jgi:hypothetical protein
VASDRPRKAKKSKHATKSREFRHADGDRRRRGGPTADRAIRDKRARQTFGGGVPADDPPPAA